LIEKCFIFIGRPAGQNHFPYIDIICSAYCKMPKEQFFSYDLMAPEITKVCLTLPDIRSGKDSLFIFFTEVFVGREQRKIPPALDLTLPKSNLNALSTLGSTGMERLLNAKRAIFQL
jgi:hypothetical protein